MSPAKGGTVFIGATFDGTQLHAALLRIDLSHTDLDVFRLLAIFWLENGTRTKTTLKDFVTDREIAVPGSVLKEAIRYLRYWPAGVSADGWTAMFSMLGDREAIWRYMLDAVAVARTDGHLAKIATSLAERLLREGELPFERFERQAATDLRFARMMMAIRRNHVGEENWRRLQSIQGRVSDPLAA